MTRSPAENQHPEAHCRRCGCTNHSWVAPSPLWNAVMRGGDINGDEAYSGIVCAACFIDLAESAGIAQDWRLIANDVRAELQTVTPSGRVWNPETWLWEAPVTSPVENQQTMEAALRLADVLSDALADPKRYEWGEGPWEHLGDAERDVCVLLDGLRDLATQAERVVELEAALRDAYDSVDRFAEEAGVTIRCNRSALAGGRGGAWGIRFQTREDGP